MDDIFKNFEEYNPNKKHKILIVFYMLCNKNLNPIVTELFIRGRRPNISLVSIRQSYFTLPKNVKLNSIHYFTLFYFTNHGNL